MVDVVDPEVRSRMMSSIRGKNTKPELVIRKLLHADGFRFRLHRKDLPGSPDIVLPKYNAVVMVNGCFWHGHACSFFKWPKTRASFWHDKIIQNIRRDQRNCVELEKLGWRVCVLWECEVRAVAQESLLVTAQVLTEWLKSSSARLDIPHSRNQDSMG